MQIFFTDARTFIFPLHALFGGPTILLFRAAALLVTVNDPAARQIVGRKLHRHAVTRKNANEILPHFSADMSQNPLAIGQDHPKHRVWKHFGYNTFRD